jgi:hypothetical protein
LTSTLGLIFHPGPRSRAQSAPVPSVARAPPPTEPSKFSGLMERVCTERSAEIPLNSGDVMPDEPHFLVRAGAIGQPSLVAIDFMSV